MSAHRLGTWGALLLLLSATARCGSDASKGSIAAKNYDRKCTSVADCFPVYEGPVGCCGGACPNTAIRQDALTKYMSDFDRAVTSVCHGLIPPCPAGPICDQEMGRVTCDNAVCQLEGPSADAGSD